MRLHRSGSRMIFPPVQEPDTGQANDQMVLPVSISMQRSLSSSSSLLRDHACFQETSENLLKTCTIGQLRDAQFRATCH